MWPLMHKYGSPFVSAGLNQRVLYNTGPHNHWLVYITRFCELNIPPGHTIGQLTSTAPHPGRAKPFLRQNVAEISFRDNFPRRNRCTASLAE